jgi:YHS domain-containing protein
MPASFISGGIAMATAKDPICAMDVDTTNPPGGTSVHAGQTYYFCSSGCRKTFEKDPAKYAS